NGDELERVAGRADFAVDLEASLQLRLVVLSERSCKRPPVLGRGRGLMPLRQSRREGRQTGHATCCDKPAQGHGLSHALGVPPGAGAGAPAGNPCLNTACEIEPGRSFVFSTGASTGRMIKKYAK